MGPAAAALSCLPSLTSVTLANGSPLGLTAHLTGLTSLWLINHQDTEDSWVAAAASNPKLQSLSVVDDEESDVGDLVSADSIQQLLASCPRLTYLDLKDSILDQEGLDELLRLGTSITTLRVNSMLLHSSRADAVCKWSRLSLTAEADDFPNVLHLAYLPLRTVQELEMHTSLWELHVPVGLVTNSQLAGLVHQAATNIAESPLWAKEVTSQLILFCDPGELPDHLVSLEPEERVALLQALATMGGPRILYLDLRLRGINLTMGRAEVQAVRSSVGPQLESLELEQVTLTADFWAALPDTLPNLDTLRLGPGTTFEAMDLAVCCCRIPATRSFAVSMDRTQSQACNVQQLRASLSAQGFDHVSIHVPP
jgi:hypothetical protein